MSSAHTPMPGDKNTLKSGRPVSEPKLEAGTSQIRSTNPDYSNTAFCDETKENRNTPLIFNLNSSDLMLTPEVAEC